MPPPALLGALLLALALPAPAAAGAWLKERGEIYLAFSLDGATDVWTGIYAEWGLTDSMTLGLAAGRTPPPTARWSSCAAPCRS